VVAEPPADYRIVHNGLVRLSLEVRIPARPEVWGGPVFELLELLRSWPDLDAGFDAVGSEGTGAFEVPFVKHPLLYLGVTAGEVIERLCAGLGTKHGECQVMVLEVLPDAGKIDNRLDTDGSELLGITCGVSVGEASKMRQRTLTDTGALENKGRRHGAARDDDLLARTEDTGSAIIAHGLGWHGLNANSPPILNDNLLDLGVAGQVEVRVYRASGMDVCVGTITTTAGVTVYPLQPLFRPVAGFQVLQIIHDGDPLRLGSPKEVILDGVGTAARSATPYTIRSTPG